MVEDKLITGADQLFFATHATFLVVDLGVSPRFSVFRGALSGPFGCPRGGPT